jgi:glucokinase
MKIPLPKFDNNNNINKYKIPKNYIVLIGDIGGVHSRFRLLNMTSNISNIPIILKEVNESTVSHNSLEELIINFLSDIKPEQKPEYAFMSMPGPIENNCIITLPNIQHWKLYNGTELGIKLGINNFIFINDFEGNGYAIQTNLIENKDYIVLNKVKPKKNGAKLMIGPGTGLGMGYLLKDNNSKYYTIGSSEGGGRDYAPKSNYDLKLRSYIKNELNVENVSLEKMCSARTLIPIYKFLHIYENDNKDENSKFKREPKLAKKIDNFHEYKEINKINEINSELIKKGLNNQCKLSKKTLLVFIEIFGEIAGDLALFTLAYNGVYLLGRLTRELTPLILDNTIFMNHFKNKDHFWFLLERIPVYLIQNENIELIGVTEAARRYFEDIENY